MRTVALRVCASAALAAACGGGGGDGGPTDPGPLPSATPGPAGTVSFTVDSSVSRHPISPYIYGMNQASWSGRSRGLRLARLGGNRWTAYNWETNASNAGADYRHQNDDYLGGGNVPGEAVRPHVAAAHAAGASMIVTVPMAGYVSADKSPSGDVNQTPDWLETRFLESRARKGRGFTFPPDTGDGVVFQDEFVSWLESTFPAARADPFRSILYSLDNEPDLWASTHPRIRPAGKVTYAEMVERTTAFASAIKAVVPDALVFGPVSYGWAGFASLQDAPDAGGRDFLEFYLASMREAEGRSGRRLVDVLDLHWYPEARGGGVRITEPDATPAVAAARVQAPRSLWDAGYVETSWISIDARVGAIRLIPRIKEKISARYPGTGIAITEYTYGGGGDISGAIAQADALGIFGREDVFAAALWDPQGGTRFIDAAFAAYCDYDGRGGRFGDTAIGAVTSNHVETSVYASVDTGREDRVVLVAINKADGPREAEVLLTHPLELTRGETYRITSGASAVQPGPPVSARGGNAFRVDLPPSSVSTIVLTR